MFLFAAILFVPIADSAPEQPVESHEIREVGEQCAVGGLRIGGSLEPPKGYPYRSPRIKRLAGENVRIRKEDAFSEYVGRIDGRVVEIAREYDGEQILRLYEALTHKYGDPSIGEAIPQVKANYSPFGGSIKFESRALWRDDQCGLEIEMVKQSRTVFTGFGGGSGDRAIVIWRALPHEEAPGEHLIE